MNLRKVIGVILSVSLLTAPLCQVVSAEEVFAGTVSKNETDIALMMDESEEFIDGMMNYDIPEVPEVPTEDESRTTATSSDRWDKEYDSDSKSTITIDRSTYYSDAGYSIKISNSDYTCATIGKTFSVKPNTMYRFSAMVKCNNLEGDPEGTYYEGACIGEYWTYNQSKYYKGSDWKKLEYKFTTADTSETITLALHNGVWAEKCKGTVWFSNVMLEELVSEKSNEWNVLNIVLKNVDVKGITYDNKVIDYHDTFDNDDVAYLKEYNEHSAALLEEFSGGLMKVKCVDTVSTDDPIDELALYEYNSNSEIESSYSIHAYRLDENTECLSKILDKYIDGTSKTYNVINLYAPLSGVAGDSTGTAKWLGLNGNYRGIYFTQMQYKSGSKSYDRDRESPAMVHELLHQLESGTQKINPDMYVALHSRDLHGYDNNKDWYIDYMQGKVDGSKGVDKSLYKVYSDVEYKLIFGERVTDPDDSEEFDPLNIQIGSETDLLRAFEQINDPAQDYCIVLTDDIQVSTLKLPRTAKSITIKSESGARLTITSPKKITARYPLTLRNIDFVCSTPVKIYCTKTLDIESVSNLGNLVSKGNMTLSGDDMRILGTVTAKGRYTTLTAGDVTFDKKVSCGGDILLEGCTLSSSLKAGGKLTLRGNNTVAGRVSARQMVSEAGE